MIRIGPAGWSYRDWEGVVVHALQLRHRLEGEVQQIPDPLLQTCPKVGWLLES